MTPKIPLERRLSAGGVVIRLSGGGPQVVLCGRKIPPLWALPKGTPEASESPKKTALREVKEETGLEVCNEGFLDSIQYRFCSPGGTRVHKTVLFYLMVPVGGSLSLHDCEFDDVRWFLAAQALEMITYPSEAKIVQKGLDVVSRRTAV